MVAKTTSGPLLWGDMVVVSGDPLRNIKVVEDVDGVIKGGVPVEEMVPWALQEKE